MPDKKLTQLSEQTSPATSDILYLVRPSGPSSFNVTLEKIGELLGGGGGGATEAYTLQTGNYTVQASDSVIAVNNSSDCTITLPSASGIQGKKYRIVKLSNNSKGVIIEGNGSETIGGFTAWPMYSKNDYVVIVSDGTNWVVVSDFVIQKKLTTTDDNSTTFFSIAIPVETFIAFEYAITSMKITNSTGEMLFMFGQIFARRDPTSGEESHDYIIASYQPAGAASYNWYMSGGILKVDVAGEYDETFDWYIRLKPVAIGNF